MTETHYFVPICVFYPAQRCIAWYPTNQPTGMVYQGHVIPHLYSHIFGCMLVILIIWALLYTDDPII